MKEYETLIKEYLELKNKIKELDQQQDFVKSQIKVLLERDGKNEFYGEAATIRLTTRMRESLDKVAAQNILGDGFKDIMKTTTFDVLTVKEK